MFYDPTDGCPGCGTIGARHAPDCEQAANREHHIICIPADALTDTQRDALYALIADIAEQIPGATSAIEIVDDCDCRSATSTAGLTCGHTPYISTERYCTDPNCPNYFGRPERPHQ